MHIVSGLEVGSRKAGRGKASHPTYSNTEFELKLRIYISNHFSIIPSFGMVFHTNGMFCANQFMEIETCKRKSLMTRLVIDDDECDGNIVIYRHTDGARHAE